MDSQVEQTPKCTPETLGDACKWLSELPVRDLVVGKVPYVRLTAVARDQLADLLAGASSALSASLALPKVESETIERQIDAGAKFLRETHGAGKRLTPWPDTPKATKKKWLALSEGVLRASGALNTGGTHE